MSADLSFGGVDNTSHTGIFALYLLASNQEKQEKLAQEISSTSCIIFYLLTISYLRAVMKESLRMMPPALENIRQLNKPLVVKPVNTEHTYHLDPGTNYNRHIRRWQGAKSGSKRPSCSSRRDGSEGAWNRKRFILLYPCLLVLARGCVLGGSCQRWRWLPLLWRLSEGLGLVGLAGSFGSSQTRSSFQMGSCPLLLIGDDYL